MSFPFTAQLTDAAVLQQSVNKDYPMGTRGITEDGRVYRYCRADSNGIERSMRLCTDMHTYKVDGSEDYWQGTLSAAAAAGDMTLTTLDTTSAHVADYFEGGYAYIRPTSVSAELYRIQSNTAAGTSTTVTLHAPLKNDCASAGVVMLCPSIYAEVRYDHQGGDTKAHQVCVANFAPITAYYYFWGQTWGPCIGFMSEGNGMATYSRRLVSSYDGSIMVEKAVTAENINQRAGRNMMYQTDAQTNGLLLYNLELAP